MDSYSGKSNSSTLYVDSAYFATINYLSLFDIKVTKATIRKYFLELMPANHFGIQEIKGVLNKLNISTTQYKVNEIGLLSKIKNPVISWITENDKPEYICIEEVTEEFVAYHNEYSALIKESIFEFSRKWAKIVLLGDPSGALEELEIEMEEMEEIESFSNDIRIIDNFVSPEICDEIVNYCNQNQLFQRSRVTQTDTEEEVSIEISHHRTSHSSNLNNITDLYCLTDIYDRICDLLQIPDDNIEPAQCVKYLPGTFFSPHFDTGSEFKNPRKYTIIIYLNDDFIAGETYFPELRMKVTPQKGRAVIFDNLYGNGILCNPLSLHAGLPVKEGFKYICTIWTRLKNVHEYESH
ncbi:2OG-Fe(II) oxygenase [Chitinophaga sp. 30R24]|uniref:2OG-Fe(II) oxygenase n=1 Tax=Chitinophaga sp. 30R24 TaxID=3248838 RepID=UPI003B8FBE4C